MKRDYQIIEKTKSEAQKVLNQWTNQGYILSIEHTTVIDSPTGMYLVMIVKRMR